MSGAGQRVNICSTSNSSTCASHRPAHTTWLAGDATNGRDLGQTHPRQGKAPASPTAVALRVNCCGSVTSRTDQCWLVHQVPLGARYNEVIPEDRRFTPQMLVTKLRSEGKEVGCFWDNGLQACSMPCEVRGPLRMPISVGLCLNARLGWSST